ncbi:MAG: DUF1232 domain-containing protein [Clostridia bacterium]|nr:DUF1232 domain-containing protein [Clostridia bacterium]
MQFVGFRVLIKRIAAIKSMMRDKSVSLWKKLLIVVGIAYVIMPFDLIPMVAFPLNIVDDVALWIGIIFGLRKTLDSYWYGSNVIDFSKKFNDNNVVEGVEFNVEDDDE